MRLIGYVRVSRVAGRSGISFISPKVQREQIERCAQGRGHTIIDWIEDLDESGGKANRPGFQEALGRIESGEADGMIVAKLDRFARSLSNALHAIERINAVGGDLVSVAEDFDTSTPMGRAMLQISLVFAELERERIKETWDVSRRRAIGRGVHISNVPPFGYKRGADGRLLPDKATADLVRQLFARRAAGWSWSRLAAFLDEAHVTPPRGGKAWVRQTLWGIISSRTYLGEARQGEIVNMDAHEPLVTRAEWEAAQSTRNRPPVRYGSAMLTGIVRCASCGHVMTRRSDGRRGYLSYECNKRHQDGVCAAPAKISVLRADPFVEETFLEWAEAEGIALDSEPRTDDLDASIRQLEAAEAELVAYRDANLVSVIGRETYVAGLSERAKAVEVARSSFGKAQAANVVPLYGRRDLPTLWPTLTDDEKRAIIGSAVEAVYVTQAGGSGQATKPADRLSIVWRGEATQRATLAPVA